MAPFHMKGHLCLTENEKTEINLKRSLPDKCKYPESAHLCVFTRDLPSSECEYCTFPFSG
jgi:hypothetical protein